jgi:hypothetical protein
VLTLASGPGLADETFLKLVLVTQVRLHRTRVAHLTGIPAAVIAGRVGRLHRLDQYKIKKVSNPPI